METRIAKAVRGDYDAIILAEAGLIRLGLEDMIAERFSLTDLTPAPGQGSLAVICRADNLELIKLLKRIEDSQSRAEFEAERALLEKIEGGCRFPVGAIAVTGHNFIANRSRLRPGNIRKKYRDTRNPRYLTLYVSVFSADGTRNIKLRKRANIKNARKLGLKMGKLLINGGAQDLASGWREAVQKWNSL